MLSSGLPEVSSTDDIQYVRDALLPGKTEAEATYAFTKWVCVCRVCRLPLTCYAKATIPLSSH